MEYHEILQKTEMLIMGIVGINSLDDAFYPPEGEPFGRNGKAGNVTIGDCIKKRLELLDCYYSKDKPFYSELQWSCAVDVLAEKIVISKEIAMPRLRCEMARNILLFHKVLGNDQLSLIAAKLTHEDLIERYLRLILTPSKVAEYIQQFARCYHVETEQDLSIYFDLLYIKFITRILAHAPAERSESVDFGCVAYNPHEVLGYVSKQFYDYIVFGQEYVPDIDKSLNMGINIAMGRLKCMLLNKEDCELPDNKKTSTYIFNVKPKGNIASSIKALNIKYAKEKDILQLIRDVDEVKEGDKGNFVEDIRNSMVLQVSVNEEEWIVDGKVKEDIYKPLLAYLAVTKKLSYFFVTADGVDKYMTIADLSIYSSMKIHVRGVEYISWRYDKEESCLNSVLSFFDQPIFGTIVRSKGYKPIENQYGSVHFWLKNNFKDKVLYRADATMSTDKSLKDFFISCISCGKGQELLEFKNGSDVIPGVEVVIMEPFHVPTDLRCIQKTVDQYHIDVIKEDSCV